jgi:hypothetical protein
MGWEKYVGNEGPYAASLSWHPRLSCILSKRPYPS